MVKIIEKARGTVELKDDVVAVVEEKKVGADEIAKAAKEAEAEKEAEAKGEDK